MILNLRTIALKHQDHIVKTDKVSKVHCFVQGQIANKLQSGLYPRLSDSTYTAVKSLAHALKYLLNDLMTHPTHRLVWPPKEDAPRWAASPER